MNESGLVTQESVLTYVPFAAQHCCTTSYYFPTTSVWVGICTDTSVYNLVSVSSGQNTIVVWSHNKAY